MASNNEYDQYIEGTPVAPAAGSAPANEYDAAIDGMDADRKTGLQQSVFVASKTTPDRAAEVQRIANENSLPVGVVERNYETFAKKQKELVFDYDSIIENTPKTASWLQDPSNASVSLDDVDTLQAMERAKERHSAALTLYENLNSGIAGMFSGAAKAPAFVWDLSAAAQNVAVDAIGLPDSMRAATAPTELRNNFVAKYFEEQSSAWKQPVLSKSISDEFNKGNYGEAAWVWVNHITANAPLQAALLAGAVSGMGVPALVGAGLLSAAEANDEAQGKVKSGEVSPETATLGAAAKGTIEAAFESLGTMGIFKSTVMQLEKALGKEGAKSVVLEGVKMMAFGAVQEGKEEAATSVAQDFTDYLTGVNPNALEGIGQRAIDAGLVGVGASSTMTAPSAVTSVLAERKTARMTQMTKDFYLSMGKTAEASKLRERLPTKQREFVENLVKDSNVENIFVPTQALETLFQAENPTKTMQQLGLLEEYNQAKEAGTDVKIPMATWVEKVVGTPAYQALADDVKFDPSALSVNELKAQREETARVLEQEAKKAQEAGTKTATIEQSAKAIGSQIADQLKAAGQNEDAAVIQERFFNTLSQRYAEAGIQMSPEQLFEQYKVSIQGPNATPTPANPAQVLNQTKLEKEGYTFAIEPWSDNLNPSESEGSFRVVARLNGEEVGVAKFKKGKDGETIYAHHSRVHHEQQRKGIASAMYDLAEHETGLTVRPSESLSNDARAFWESRRKQMSGQVLDQSQPAAPAFYSKLQQLIDEKMGASATTQQIQGLIRDIKPEERKWSGIDEFLKGKEKVTKAELLEFLAANQLQIQEVTKGLSLTEGKERRKQATQKFEAALLADGSTQGEADGILNDLYERPSQLSSYQIAFRDRPELAGAATDFVEALKEDEGGATKFSKYTLPGGENYREVLFTLPPQKTNQIPQGFSWREAPEKERSLGAWQLLDADKRIAGFGNTKEEALADYDRVQAGAKQDGAYRSNHWDEANVLAHVRLNDRTDADGKKVLFVEEIQSDWHQAGRKKGYKGELPTGMRVEPEPNEKLGKFRVVDSEGNLVAHGDTKQAAMENVGGGGQVPQAPFRKTWHEFAMKRILRMAAEGGYDRVAWTTGEQQAERYDLSKQIKEVQYRKLSESDQPGGGFAVVAIDNSGDEVWRSFENTTEEIERALGKEIAAKISEDKGKAYRGRDFKSLEGVDLKVGGEGMKGFYDKILVDFANKFGKKYGAKVGEANLPITEDSGKWKATKDPINGWFGENFKLGEQLTDGDGATRFFDTKEEAESAIQEKLDFDASNPYVSEDVRRVHSLDVTPELRTAALNEGFSLFQDGPADPRGQIALMPNEALIRLGKAADASTFFHESGHYFFEFLTRLNAQADTPQTVKDDYATLLKWMGVEEGQAPNVEQLETFARGFEAYIMEGKAPSNALKKAFATFKIWLTNVYRSLRSLRVELTPEVRGVMDRLLATDEELAAARVTAAQEPLVKDAMVAGMRPELAAKYQKATLAARQFAEEEMTNSLMRDLKKKQQAEYRDKRKEVQLEMEKVVGAQPNQRALAALQLGTNPDGSPLPPDMPAIKLDKRSVQQILAANGTTDLQLPRGTTSADGFPVEMVAESFGFQSAEVFLQALSETKPYRAAVEEATENMMRSLYPDLMGTPQASEEAIKALHNDARAEMLQLELEYLMDQAPGIFRDAVRRTVRRMPTLKEVRAQAERMIGKQIVREIKPALYQRGEVRAAKEAGDALAKGDIQAAFDAKNRELLNHELFRAATQAKEDLANAKPAFKRFFRANDDLAKTRDMDLINAGRAVLAEFGVGRTDKTAAEYLDPIKNYDRDTYETMIALVSAASEGAGNYEEISFDSFSSMKLALDAIWDLSKNIKTIEIEGKKVQQQVAIDAMKASLAEVTKPGRGDGYRRSADNWEKTTRGLLGLKSKARRVESWADAVEGKTSGALFDYMVRPVKNATTLFHQQKVVFLNKYLQVLKLLDADTLNDKRIAAPELGYEFRGKSQLLGMLLHTGNESNKSKLLRGYQWATQNEDGSLDTTKFDAFISRMQKEGILTKADYDYVQGVWDLFEELKPMAQKAHKSMYGFYFNEVTADEFVTPFGSYRGGYAPARVDPYENQDATKRAEKELLERSNNSFAFPTAGRGATKTRVEAYAAPLQMDLGLVKSHIDWALRFSTVEPVVKSVGKMLWNKGFSEALYQLDPTISEEMLIPWLQRAAQQLSSDTSKGAGGRFGDNICRAIRRNASLNLMAFTNVVNAVENLSGVFPALLKAKPRHMRNALWTYFRNPKGLADEIQSKSAYMSTKMGFGANEVLEGIDEILLNPTKLEEARAFARKHGQIFSKASQGIVETIAWSAAYNQAVEEGVKESEAVQQADSAVRLTQGASAPEDISRLEAGTPFHQLFTTFYGYFNMLANTLGTEFAKVPREMGLKKQAGRAAYVYVFGFLSVAMVSGIIRKLASGSLDEDDDDEYMDDLMDVFFWGQVRLAAAFAPGIGQFGMVFINRFNDKWYDDKVSLSPAFSALESTGGIPYEAYQVLANDKSKKGLVRDVLSAFGLLTGVPTGALARPAGYLIDVNEGNAEPTGPLDFTRGLVTGRP